MLLKTFHDPLFDITKNVTSLKKSYHYKINSSFKNAYTWLYKKIKTDKVIWCYKTSLELDKRHGYECKEWTLNVPDNKIIAGIDIDKWNSVIMNRDLVPDYIWCKWSDEWDLLYEKKLVNAKSWNSFEDEKLKKWRKKHGTKEEGWSKKIPCKTLNDANEFLIPSPIPKKWIVDVKHYSEYDINFQDTMGDGLFKTFEDAEKYCVLVKSFLNGKKLPYKLECSRYNTKHMQRNSYHVKIEKLWKKDES